MAVLELTGSVRKNPQRYRARRGSAQPKVPLIGSAPKEWVEGAETNQRCKELLEIWELHVAQDVLGVLNISHRSLLELACYQFYKLRRAAKGYGKATSGDGTAYKSTLASMGMTPIDSSRVAEAVRVPDRGAQQPAGQRAGGWGELVG